MRDVLLVDDDVDGCEPLAKALGHWGYRCTCVANGREALGAMAGRDWDAAILDIAMPEMDGVKLLDVMRSYLRWQKLPVIILTAHGSPEQLKQVRDLGVQHVFQKTMYTLDELRAALDALTGGPVALA